MTYWNHKGAHQSIYDKYSKLVPKKGKSKVPHIELLRNIANVYYDFYNNGNDTWYSVVKNGAIDFYRAPNDAPEKVKVFLMYIREEHDAYLRYLRKIDEADDSDDEDAADGVHHFTEEELENIVDLVLEYVDYTETTYNGMYNKKSGKANTSHGELLRIMTNIMNRFYNDGDATWFDIVQNGACDEDYTPPQDAPADVIRFFADISDECAAYNKQLLEFDTWSDYDDGEEWEFDPDVKRFVGQELDFIRDLIVVYVDKKESGTCA